MAKNATEPTETGSGAEAEPTGGITKLTAKLLAVAALLGAVVTILSNIDQIVGRFSPTPDPDSGPGVTTVHAHDCVSIDPDYLPVIPYSLKHNFDSSDTLYWLKLVASNQCDERFTLEVECNPAQADVGVTCTTSDSFQVDPHSQLERQIDPELEFQGEVAEEVTLRLQIRVKDDLDDGYVYNDTLRVSVLPQTTFFWDLENQTKEAVLASLAVWTIRPRASVSEMARGLARDGADGALDAWMERAYDSVFSQVEIVADDRQIPPRAGRRHLNLSTPEQVLTDGRGNPVEVALLFGALGYDVVKRNLARIVLISAPAEDEAVPNITFVAWETAGHLRAFDASAPAGSSFAAATAQAEERIGPLLELIRTTLNLSTSRGVFIHPDNERVVALDLGQTIERHHLYAGLPY